MSDPALLAFPAPVDDQGGDDREPTAVPPDGTPESTGQGLHTVRRLWILFLIAVCCKAVIDPISHSVYPCYRLAAENWWAGNNLYGDHGYWETGFVYSPTFAVAFSPFAMLPDRLGGLLWNLVNLAVSLWGLTVFTRTAIPKDWSTDRRAWFWGLVLIAFIRGLWAAQANGFVVGLVAGGIAMTLQKRYWTAALLLAIPVHIKLWPMAAVLLLIACRPRALLARVGVMLGVVGLLPFLTSAPSSAVEAYRNWLTFLTTQHQGVRFPHYRDAWTIGEELLHLPVTNLSHRVIGLVAAGLLCGLCVLTHRRIRGERFPASITATPGPAVTGFAWILLTGWSAWQLLFGPGSERNTYGIIGPALAFALVWSWGRDRLAPRIASGTAGVLLLMFGTTGALERTINRHLWSGAETLLPLSALALTIWLSLSVSELITTPVAAIEEHETELPEHTEEFATPHRRAA